MQAIITAAARSPRLLPLTKRTPVSLLEVKGKTILDHQLNALSEAGINDILVITGFCAEQIEDFCQGRARCMFNPFYEMSNVAMNLWLVRQEFKEGFLLLYADILFQPELVREVMAKDDNTLLVVDRKGLDKEAEKVELLEGRVTVIGKNVSEPYGEFIGMAKATRDTIPILIEGLERVARTNLETTFPEFIQQLIRNNHTIKVYTSDYPWMDIDFPTDLEKACKTWGI